MTREGMREFISNLCDSVNETAAAISTDLQRDGEGCIVDNSDLAIAIRELDHVSSVLSRLSFKLVIEGIEAAAPQQML